MATIFIERQIGSNATRTAVETIPKVDVNSHRRRTTGSSVHLPVITRPSHERQRSRNDRKPAAAASTVDDVDRRIRRESLSSSCPELECVTGERSKGRPLVCVVKTELPSVDRRQAVIALRQHTEPPPSTNIWNTPARRLRRGCSQQQQHQPMFHHTTNSSHSTATEAIYKVEGDQRRSQLSFDARTMRRSVSDEALPALRQSCQVDALPPLRKPPR